MSDFNWARFLGDALPVVQENIHLIPEAIKADKAIKAGDLRNDDAWANLNNMIDKATTDERFKSQLAENFGVAPEEVDVKMREFIREPRDKETTEDYLNSVGEGLSNLIQQGFKEGQDPSILTTFISQDTQGYFGDDVYAKQKERVKRQEIDDNIKQVNKGKSSVDENGKEIFTPHTVEEIDGIARNLGLDPNKVPEFVEGKSKANEERFYNNLVAIQSVRDENDERVWDTATDKRLLDMLIDKNKVGMSRAEARELIKYRNIGVANTADELGVESNRLANKEKEAKVKLLEQEFAQGNKPEPEDYEDMTSEEARKLSDEYNSVSVNETKASKTSRGQNSARDKSDSSRKIKNADSLAVMWADVADSIDNLGGSTKSGNVEGIKTGVINKRKGDSVVEDFNETRKRFKDIKKIAKEKGLEITTPENEYSPTGVVTMTDGKTVFRINLLDGSIKALSKKEQMDESLNQAQRQPTQSVDIPAIGVSNSNFTPSIPGSETLSRPGDSEGVKAAAAMFLK